MGVNLEKYRYQIYLLPLNLSFRSHTEYLSLKIGKESIRPDLVTRAPGFYNIASLTSLFMFCFVCCFVCFTFVLNWFCFVGFFLGRVDVGDGSGSRISNENVEWSRIHNLKSFDQSKITHNFRFYNSTIDIAISAFLSNDIFIICTWSNWYKQNKFFRDLLFCTVLNNNKSSTLYHVHMCPFKPLMRIFIP